MHYKTHIELNRAEVADRARQLWKADGSPNGRSLEYWLQAEVELLNVRDGYVRTNLSPSSDPPRRAAQEPARQTRAWGVAVPIMRRNGSKRASAPTKGSTGNTDLSSDGMRL